MASSALQFDLTTAYLDQPSFIGYGLVRGAGNLVFQQQFSDSSTLAFYVLGDGPWDSQLRLWINRKAIALPSANVHFHPGLDGEIGTGMAATSTGSDQHVDAFWSSVPGLTPVTYSRYAWLAVKVPPDPGAPTASLELLADYQAMRCRLFDASGNQTAFQWTQNPAWWICDRIIRKFVLREAKVNQPLVAAELARFDWQSFSDAAAYYDVDIGGGIKRFSDGGAIFLDGSLTEDRVLEQLLLMCRSYILERNGKICLYADQARASVFTFTSDNIAPQSFVAKKSNLRTGKNRISASFREIAKASGSADDATRFAVATQRLDHEAHQRAIGVRGPGLSVIPKALELQLDFGNNTAERVARLLQYQLVRQLGDDADPNLVYNAPFAPEWTGYEDSLKVEPGDVTTIDPSISEEFGGKLYEVLEVEERPDGTRAFKGLEYEANAFTDVAPTQQLIEAPNPGTGLAPIATGVDANGNQQIGVSTALNLQGNIALNSLGINFLQWDASSPTPSGPSVIKFKWAAISDVRGDGSTLAIPASTALSVPAAPTLGQVAGGALAARTYYVRVALVKNGMMHGISAESSLAISLNNLLKVTSPAAVAEYDGWLPLINITTNLERQINDTYSIDSPVPFGTDYMEPATGYVFAGALWSNDNALNGGAQGVRRWDLALGVLYYWYAAVLISQTMVCMMAAKLTAASQIAATKQSSDGYVALSIGAIQISQPAGSSSGSGSGGSAGGGRGNM